MKEKKKEEPLLTIRCLAYNHEQYIRQCLEGFVMQQTNFKFIAVIHDDASTDKTVNIIKEFEKKYPDIIKPVYENENQYSKQDGSLRRIMNKHMKGKYIAMCEGDDYWTDPCKLQKQVDFLEQNPNYVFCCHRFKVYDENNDRFLSEYGSHAYVENEDLVIDKELFSKVWVTQILTTVFRTKALMQAHQEIQDEKYTSGKDVYLYYTLLNQGNGISLNDFMGVYRWNNGGVAGLLPLYKRTLNGYLTYKEIFQKNKADKFIERKFVYSLIGYIRYGKLQNMKEKINLFKEGFSISNSFKEKLNLIFSLFVPQIFFSFIIKVYLKLKWRIKQENIKNA